MQNTENEIAHDLEIMRKQEKDFLARHEKNNTLSVGITPDGRAHIAKVLDVPQAQSEQDFVVNIYKIAAQKIGKFAPQSAKKPQLDYEIAKKVFYDIYVQMLESVGVTAEQVRIEMHQNPSRREFCEAAVKYFIGDETSAFDLQKGIYLCGNIGNGKTQLMQALSIFSQCVNYRKFKNVNTGKMIYDVRSLDKGMASLEKYHKGEWCVDELGGEQEINNYGNQDDIIQSFLLLHYSERKGRVIHATSNVHFNDLSRRYSDPRFLDRCNELFNVFVLRGSSLRK